MPHVFEGSTGTRLSVYPTTVVGDMAIYADEIGDNGTGFPVVARTVAVRLSEDRARQLAAILADRFSIHDAYARDLADANAEIDDLRAEIDSLKGDLDSARAERASAPASEPSRHLFNAGDRIRLTESSDAMGYNAGDTGVFVSECPLPDCIIVTPDSGESAAHVDVAHLEPAPAFSVGDRVRVSDYGAPHTGMVGTVDTVAGGSHPIGVKFSRRIDGCTFRMFYACSELERLELRVGARARVTDELDIIG